VGTCSKDNDARVGRVYGGFARGYKLHALVTTTGRTLVWSVTPLNASEVVVAGELLRSYHPPGVVVGDANYDAAVLYEQMAEYGGRFLAVPKRGAGRGHTRQSEARLDSLAQWRCVGRVLRRQRNRIETSFGNQAMYGGGLGPLPAWVRTLERVRRWVGGKMILHHARLAVKKAAA
jgi:IS5 family transposase